MIQSVIMVALGGALGSAARYVVSRVVQEQCATAFPLHTFAVNVVGCLLIGLVCGLAARLDGMGNGLKLFLTVAFVAALPPSLPFATKTWRCCVAALCSPLPFMLPSACLWVCWPCMRAC